MAKLFILEEKTQQSNDILAVQSWCVARRCWPPPVPGQEMCRRQETLCQVFCGLGDKRGSGGQLLTAAIYLAPVLQVGSHTCNPCLHMLPASSLSFFYLHSFKRKFLDPYNYTSSLSEVHFMYFFLLWWGNHTIIPLHCNILVRPQPLMNFSLTQLFLS